ncbi:MAG: hypothetical protein U0W24_25765 [Bacteroidales bacterium]
MKKILRITQAMVVFLVLTTFAKAQEQETTEEAQQNSFTVGTDIVSNYIWRGTKLSPGPSFQPTVKFAKGGFSAGVWGSFDFSSGYAEADPFISYSFPFGLSVGVNDYYLCNLDFFNASDTAGSHGVELTAGFTIKGFTISGNYIVNEAPGVGTTGGDTYVQLSYAVKNVNLFAGAGNGWYTSDNEFAICNLGIGVTKEITITDKFKLPLFGQVILNPERKQFFVVAGLTF